MRQKKIALGILAFCSFFALATVSAEVFLRFARPGNPEWKVAPIHKVDPDLGYSGIPGATGEEYYRVGGNVQQYSSLELDEFGFRKMPAARPVGAKDCFILLGDSNAFGIGVAAGETTANLMQKELRDTAAVYNFGYTGYGPHQVLRFLELDREKLLLQHCRTFRFYLLLMEDHVWRVLGRAPWGLSAPKYVLENGGLVYRGGFHSEWLNRLNNEAQKFALTRPLVSSLLNYKGAVSEGEWKTYQGVLEKIQAVLEKKYQTRPLFVYLLQGRDPGLKELANLQNPKLRLQFFEDWVRARSLARGNVRNHFYLPDETHLNRVGHAFLAGRFLELERN